MEKIVFVKERGYGDWRNKEKKCCSTLATGLSPMVHQPAEHVACNQIAIF